MSEPIEPVEPVRSSSEMAINAIAHVLRRVQTDSDFAWYMLHTESLSLCIDAFAVMKGRDREELKTRIIAAVQAQFQKTMPRVRELEIMRDALIAQVNSLQEAIENADDDDDDDDDDDKPAMFVRETPDGLIDLLNYCRLRSERPTVEAVEAALDGGGLGECLRHMESAVF